MKFVYLFIGYNGRIFVISIISCTRSRSVSVAWKFTGPADIPSINVPIILSGFVVTIEIMQEKKLVAEIKKTAKTGNEVSLLRSCEIPVVPHFLYPMI